MYEQSSTKMATAINRQFTEETRVVNKHKNIRRNLAGTIKNWMGWTVHRGN